MEKIIQDILTEMNTMFRTAVGVRSRPEYMAEYKKTHPDIKDHFGLTVEQIIQDKIPAQVIGCTGFAKLFCELAKKRGIEAFVVCTVRYDDWKAVKNGENRVMNGHQINAVEIDGRLRVFDATKPVLKFIDTDLTAGSFIDAMSKGNLDYMVTAVVPGNEFQSVDTCRKLMNLYISGDMNKSEFTIVPIVK